MIVTVTPTIMDGTVIRWHLSAFAEQCDSPIVTASRNGVKVDAWLSQVPDGVVDTAKAAWETLRRNNHADMSHLATHRRVKGGGLELIEPPYRQVPASSGPASFIGSDKDRQSVGDPGHCERCVSIGHVAAHPDLGCGDVGCYASHDETAS